MPDIPSERYPEDVGQAPFDKFILFEARSGRHIVRNKIIGEQGKADRTLASAALYLSDTALKSSLEARYDTNALGPFAGALVEAFAQTGQNLFNTKLGSLDSAWASLPNLKSLAAKAMDATGNLNLSNILTTFGEAIKVDLHNGLAALPGSSETAVNVLTGQKPNPRTDIVFDAMEYRQHTMDFSLIPRSLTEARAIDRIINFFQFYSLPTYKNQEQTGNVEGQNVTIGAFMIGFPYEFEIKFYGPGGKILNHVNKIGRSILRSVAIDHAAGGKTAFIRDNGEYYPVATRLGLTFQEVRLLARDSTEIQYPGGISPGDAERDPRA